MKGFDMKTTRELCERCGGKATVFIRLCDECQSHDTSCRKTGSPPLPADDVLIRGGCGREDVTVGDLANGVTFSDVLVWVVIVAVVVVFILTFTASI